MNSQPVPPGGGGDQNREYHDDIQAYIILDFFSKMPILLMSLNSIF